jgi:hypothetical protein
VVDVSGGGTNNDDHSTTNGTASVKDYAFSQYPRKPVAREPDYDSNDIDHYNFFCLCLYGLHVKICGVEIQRVACLERYFIEG